MLLVLLFQPQALATLFLGSLALCLPKLLSTVVEKGFLWVLSYPWRKLRQHLKVWKFFIDAPDQIQESYDQANGAPFVVQSPGVNFTFVSDPKHIKEIDSAPKDVLSLQGAAKILLSPNESMHHFDWAEVKGLDGAPLIRSCRSLLRHNLPFLLPKSRMDNSLILDETYNQGGNVPQMIRAAVVRVSALALFGEEIANNEEFLKTAVTFVDEVIVFTEIVRVLPKFAIPAVTRLLKLRYNSQKAFFEYLESMAQQRIDEQKQASMGHQVPEHRDCIQWVMEQSSRLRPWTAERVEPWTAGRIVHELMALWFGSIHGLSMTTVVAVQDLCLHPEYVDPLRKEFEGPAYQAFEATGKGLPLLDSFLKESARCTPLDNTSTRRKALQDFKFSDGLTIEKGKWVCTPAAAMMRDPKSWVDSHEFHGFRHVDSKILQSLEGHAQYRSPQPEKASELTDARSWQTWGTGRNSCPGRYFAAAAMKQILGLIITKYDCHAVDCSAKRTFSWRSCNVPSTQMQILLKPRALEPDAHEARL